MSDVRPVRTLLFCAGDRRVDTAALGIGARPASADEAREATGFAIGGVPPLGHERCREYQQFVLLPRRQFHVAPQVCPISRPKVSAPAPPGPTAPDEAESTRR
jgi:hypothetical protein